MSAIGQDPAGSADPGTTQQQAAPAAEPGGSPAPEGAQAPSGIDYGRIEEMLAERFAEQDQRIQQRLPEPTQPPEPTQDPYAEALARQGYDDREIEGLRNALSPLFEGVVQHALGPIQQQNQALQQALISLTNELDAGELEDRYPALQDESVAQAATQGAVQLAQRLGMPVPQDPRQLPAALIEAAHLMNVGRERVASEQPAGGGNPELEHAGGASPPEPEPDLAHQIVNAGRGQRTPASDFWGY